MFVLGVQVLESVDDLLWHTHAVKGNPEILVRYTGKSGGEGKQDESPIRAVDGDFHLFPINLNVFKDLPILHESPLADTNYFMEPPHQTHTEGTGNDPIETSHY